MLVVEVVYFVVIYFVGVGGGAQFCYVVYGCAYDIAGSATRITVADGGGFVCEAAISVVI